jgi:hypothetical protein
MDDKMAEIEAPDPTSPVPSTTDPSGDDHQDQNMEGPSNSDAHQEDDELFVPEQEPPKKRARRTPLLTSKEVRESVKIGLDNAYSGRIPSGGRQNMTFTITGKSKGRKQSKSNELDLATLGGSNIIEDAQVNAQLPSIPVSKKGGKTDALKELVQSLPEAVQKDASADKRLVLEATKKFIHKPRSDKQGGWKHPKLQTSLYHHQVSCPHAELVWCAIFLTNTEDYRCSIYGMSKSSSTDTCMN